MCAQAAEGGGGHEGLSAAPPILFHIGPFQVTNSMVVTWAVGLLLILWARKATRRMKEVPEGAQNFWEWVVEGFHNFLSGIMGPELARKTFWFFATLMIFITSANYFGLIPGVGSIGWGVGEKWYLLHVTRPLLRGANADLNMTFGMALVFFVLWFVWGIQANGVGGFIRHILGPKTAAGGALGVVMIFLFFAAGLIEIVSIMFRPVALSFRLYGNIFAGENILETMALINPWLGWLIAVPFYFQELLVGIVQALVFTLLTAAFVLEICLHDEGGGEH